MRRARTFWLTCIVAWIAMAFVPVIGLYKGETLIGRLMLGVVYVAGLGGEDVRSAWPWMLGHLAAALFVALVVSVVQRRNGA